VEVLRFAFWETAKVLALLFLGLFSVKAVAAVAVRNRWLKLLALAVILAALGFGAWYSGNDVAAEIYIWSCRSNLDRGDLRQAYSNALQALRLRPNNLSYWRSLVQTKIRLQQFQSALDDQRAIQALSQGNLDEVDEYQFALCEYFLGQYNDVVATTLRLIRQNPSYAAPYILQGWTYTAEKKYLEAQQSLLAVLQLFPDNQAAVESLARAYYLGGDRQRALGVLDQTANYSFSPAARKRFLALKEFYDQ
jgi:tetratricopeptide (TPR) repeat protein